MQIQPISAFSDNYIWCLHDQEHALLVDPGDADAAITYIEEKQLTLIGILITHKHWDHVDGLPKIRERWPNAPVYGPHNDVTSITQRLEGGQQLAIKALDLQFDVIAVPGHTLDHIAYYHSGNPGFLLCGDTLFSCGCGRLFEGTAAQMHESLQRLASLPADTLVYCTHEYTQANIAFAKQVEPGNQALLRYEMRVAKQRNQGLPSLPTHLAEQLQINPFLRVAQPQIKEALAKHGANLLSNSNKDAFAALRRWKDQA